MPKESKRQFSHKFVIVGFRSSTQPTRSPRTDAFPEVRQTRKLIHKLDMKLDMKLDISYTRSLHHLHIITYVQLFFGQKHHVNFSKTYEFSGGVKHSLSIKPLALASATGAITLGLGLVGASSAQAAGISRSGFNANAVNFNFETATTRSTTATDGNLTATNGIVLGDTSLGPIIGKAYFDGSDSSVIRFDFLNPVSAFGLDFASNNAPNVTLSIFDNANNLIESLTLDSRTLPRVSGFFPYGFIGLNAGSNSIAYATIDTPLNGNELFVDNAIYQYSAVPEPLTMLGAGAAIGFGASFKRKLAKKKEDKANKA